MGYRQQTGSSKSGGRGHQRSPHEKKKAKEKKRRSSGKYLLEETHVPTSEEIAEKTLNRLHSLGNQVFALFPFRVYFDDWLVNLRDVLNTFESSPNMSVDQEFVKERSQIFAYVEHALEEKRREEISLEEAVKGLSDSKNLLEKTEEAHAIKAKALEEQKNAEITRLQRDIANLKGELDNLAKMKAGFFRSVSKKEKAQKEADLTQKLDAAQGELESTTHNFPAKQEVLRNEYEQKKQQLIAQIVDYEKKTELMETDRSLEERRLACGTIANAVSAFLRRRTP